MGEYGTGGGFSSRVNGTAPKQSFQTTGALIMQVAELLRPRLQQQLHGAIDENGMPVQSARVRGMALIIAQEMVKVAKQKQSANA